MRTKSQRLQGRLHPGLVLAELWVVEAGGQEQNIGQLQLGLIVLDNDVLDCRTGKTTFLALTLQSWQMPGWAGQ